MDSSDGETAGSGADKKISRMIDIPRISKYNKYT